MSRYKYHLITAICLFPFYLFTNSMVTYLMHGTNYNVPLYVSIGSSIGYFLGMSGVDYVTQRN